MARDRPLLNAAVGLGLAGVIIHGLTSGDSQPGGEPAAASVTAAHGSGGATPRQAATAIAFARAQVGKPYVYGATGPDSYDCSGLTRAAWAAAGVSIPRTSEDQWKYLRHVPLHQARPGDLVFETGSSIDAPPGHVVLYLGRHAGHDWILEAYGSGYPIRVTLLRWADAWGEAVRPGGHS